MGSGWDIRPPPTQGGLLSLQQCLPLFRYRERRLGLAWGLVFGDWVPAIGVQAVCTTGFYLCTERRAYNDW